MQCINVKHHPLDYSLADRYISKSTKRMNLKCNIMVPLILYILCATRRDFKKCRHQPRLFRAKPPGNSAFSRSYTIPIHLKC